MPFVIGDIHGEYEKLKALLTHIPRRASLVFIGDYIDKGPRSREVVDLIIGLKAKRRVVCLTGNHEFKLLRAWDDDPAALRFLIDYGFQPTLESYTRRKISSSEFRAVMANGSWKKHLKKHLLFFRSLKISFETRDFFVVHAGLPVDIHGRFTSSNLEKMVFARERFWETKKLYRGKRIVFGHTAFKKVFFDGFKVGIDTGAGYAKKGGCLSALDTDARKIINDRGKTMLLTQLTEGQNARCCVLQ